MATKRYEIKAALSTDAMESWIWSNDPDITSRGFIIIKNSINGNKLKAFKRSIDANYIRMYNQANTVSIVDQSNNLILIMNEYQRNRLSVTQNNSFELSIKPASTWDKLFRIHLYHPNPTVQYANRATILSCILAVVALILTIYSLILTIKL